ncbi:MAG: PLP-dependent transferase [Opitutales bacterium]|nr:PLP-dependent transferase [Opitutales bacterium]
MLKHYPLGDPINGSPHSVCVSLPTMAGIIGYEEGDAAVRGALRTGYPRFITHPLVVRLKAAAAESMGEAAEGLFPVASVRAADRLRGYAGVGGVFEWGGLAWARVPEEGDARARAGAFLQHTGCGVSSREAEDVLIALGLLSSRFSEASEAEDAGGRVRRALHACYGTASPDDIVLARGGMNAFYAGFRLLSDYQRERGRTRWVRLGWLYVDTIRVLERLNGGGPEPVVFNDVADLHALERLLAEEGATVAGIVTEVPTNPLLETTDVRRLRALADRAGCALILDPTLASPHNVNVLPVADLHINSLTKYACRAGDVMIGAAALNRVSPFYDCLRAGLAAEVERPYARDLARLAAQIDGYGPFVRAVNRSVPRVAAFLESHSAVERVWWARQPDHGARFESIAHKERGAGCMVSFLPKAPLARVYDRLRMAKSPSFGTEFSMICPFLYLAHYDLVSTPEGREQLRSAGLAPDLLRLSVGVEPVKGIIEALDEALSD